MAQLVLASQSPRRKELIGHLGVSFATFPAEINEDLDILDPHELVKELAFNKAHKVKEKLKANIESLFVIGSDTTVYCEKKILEKPRDLYQAKEMLEFLAGKKHQVLTGVCVLSGDTELSFVEISDVTFRPFHHKVLEQYLSTGDSLDKAGAYGIQGPSLTFIEKLEGSYSNVVGFPLDRFIWEFEKCWGDLYQLFADSKNSLPE